MDDVILDMRLKTFRYGTEGGPLGFSEMKKAELVFVPTPGAGHYISAVEFAKRLIHTDDRFSVTLLHMRSSLHPHTDPYNTSLLASETHLRIIDLPPVDPPPSHLIHKSVEHYILLYFESFIPHVKDAITHLMSNPDSVPLAGLVLDFFCLPMIDVAKELGLPSYLYLTSGAGFLGLMLYLPTRHSQIGTEFEDSDPDLELRSFVNPVPVRVLPEAVSNKHGGYAAYIKVAQRFREARGIIVNTFSELEPYAVESFADGQTPPVYTVGPVLDLGGQAHSCSDRVDHGKIMGWLDAQPESSVVFLCFGSMGTFDAPQVREIALGLERSGHRFLWALRLLRLDGKLGGSSDGTELSDILPEGFLDRIGERGMICEWAPQMEALSHKSIGGFLSHCGWNSILESIWNSVPVATWPMYAEQQLNAFGLVKELGLAVEMRLDYRQIGGEVVMAEEIDGAIRCVMEHDSMVRKKVKEMGEMSRRAVMDGGSSSKSLGRLIADIMNHPQFPTNTNY